MTTDGERIAVTEQEIRDIRGDVSTLMSEVGGVKDRLRALEATAEAALAVQRHNRRQEKAENDRITQFVGIGGLLMTLAIVALSVVTIITHG